MLTPSLSIAGLTDLPEAQQGPRALIEWGAKLGYRAIQLDATLSGIRPRDLDRSARRDLAALLRRLQLGFSGLDLWIPPNHFTDPTQQDRAITATISALEMAVEIARLGDNSGGVVSLVLPADLADTARQTLTRSAERCGATIADHLWPMNKDTAAPFPTGIDPAALLITNADPAAEVTRLPAPPASARLSDADTITRVVAGKGRLDLLAYQVALVTKGYNRELIVDLRAVRNQTQGAQAGLTGPGA